MSLTDYDINKGRRQLRLNVIQKRRGRPEKLDGTKKNIMNTFRLNYEQQQIYENLGGRQWIERLINEYLL